MANSWFLNVSEIELGGSAVLGNNYTWFYTIHIVAVTIITISMLACATVIISIITSWSRSRQSDVENQSQSRQAKSEFVDRFPFYLAVADFLWGCSNLPAHLVLLITQKYPSSDLISLLIAVNMSAFLG